MKPHYFLTVSLLIPGCQGGVQLHESPGAAVETRQTQAVASIESAVVRIAASMPAVTAKLEALSPQAGRNLSTQFGVVNLAGQDVSSQIPAAALACLAGLLWLQGRRKARHVWSLTKAIRAAHDEMGDENTGLICLRDKIEKITRADGTEGDNEKAVKRLKPRKAGVL